MVTIIPQRVLRNDIGDVLRRAEAGEQFTITVSGRPVAQLGPVAADGPQREVSGDRVADVLGALPPVLGLREELREAVDLAARDPFE